MKTSTFSMGLLSDNNQLTLVSTCPSFSAWKSSLSLPLSEGWGVRGNQLTLVSTCPGFSAWKCSLSLSLPSSDEPFNLENL